MFFFQILSVGFLRGYADFFFCFFLEKQFFEFYMIFFCFSLSLDPKGTKISKRYSSLRSITNGSKLFVNFLLYGPHDVDFLDF